MLGQQTNHYAPGNFQRNAAATGYGQAGNSRTAFTPAQYTQGKFTSQTNPFQNSGGGGGGSSGFSSGDFNRMFGSVPTVKAPTTKSSINLEGILANYLPDNVVQASTNNQVADAQSQFSPQQYLDRHAASPGNIASASSGQTLQMMPGMMAPGMQEAAMLKASNPINAALSRYDLETKGLGAQSQEAMQLARIGLAKQAEAMNQYQQRMAFLAQMAQMG